MLLLQPVNGKVIVNHVNHVGEHCYVDNIEPAYQNSWDMPASSPGGSNRNSAASSDSGRGLSTNYLDPKVGSVSMCWRWNEPHSGEKGFNAYALSVIPD